MTKTPEQIETEALAKYKRISDKKKQQHLNNRKKAIKKNCIIIMMASFFMSIAHLVLAIVYSSENLAAFIICSALCAVVGIAFLVVMIIQLKKPEEKLILEELRHILKKTYSQLTYQWAAQYKQLVKQHSLMYKNIAELNSMYSFNQNVCKKHTYNEYLNSKKQFDNFDTEKWIFSKIEQNASFFESMQSIYENEIKKYKEYSKQYDSLEEYREEIDIENLEIEYEVFNYIEKRLYEESKYSDIEKPSIKVNYSYTSPTGRNHYSSSYYYSYSDLLYYIEYKKEEDQKSFNEQRKKAIETQKKKEKERKLNELEKIEKQLFEKAQKLNQKEKEFFEATREHIYTSEKVEQQTTSLEMAETASLTEKLKLLRKKFDNGEISYDEYKNKRKELM